MKFIKKRASAAQQLHAALTQTDPTSSDLILLSAPGFRPALRLLPLPAAPVFARRTGALPARRRSRALAWRRRPATTKKSTVTPV